MARGRSKKSADNAMAVKPSRLVVSSRLMLVPFPMCFGGRAPIPNQPICRAKDQILVLNLIYALIGSNP